MLLAQRAAQQVAVFAQQLLGVGETAKREKHSPEVAERQCELGVAGRKLASLQQQRQLQQLFGIGEPALAHVDLGEADERRGVLRMAVHAAGRVDGQRARE